MKASELRQKYLDFFKENGHAVISGSSLIPENDPTVLFTTAGMHPLVPYLLGEKHPAGIRLASVQKCIRTGDIEEVGDKTHHTFFEMLGNWSLGDYFKEKAINYSFEFLTSKKYLGLDKNRLAVSVFVGDESAPYDEEAYNIWEEIFKSNSIPIERIAKLPKKNNWWDPAGTTGPCGPDTEIFYWSDDNVKAPMSFNDDHDSWVEIWNNVFMQYNKTESGTYELLTQKNVDTGMGLERTLAVMNNLADNYQTELFINLIKKIEDLSGLSYTKDEVTTKSMRIISDHIKAATFIIGDDKGVTPSNTGQGYVLRRLIRRALRYGRMIGINKKNWLQDISLQVILDYGEFYDELIRNREFIIQVINKEEDKFGRTLEKGLLEFNKISSKNISGQDAFNLYQSYGFPLEITEELAKEAGIEVDVSAFETELKKHQELSRTASAGKFKGGLADDGEETTKLHTAAHLLLASLRKVLGDHVVQKGSNITAERLRFDFSHNEKMTKEQISEVEKLVNEAIESDLPIVCEELSLEEAKTRGAMGVFDSKYGEMVKVYTVAPLKDNKSDLMKSVSQEICGGPHAKNTGVLGRFKISKESSSSAGVRRIKAILE
ncbi:MAG TPA: alanine--tRNA ligase [Patescibacteria group bacterium]|nr:alanine--tRNA ligase [Patescibacteria group bacterium]